MKLDQLPTEVIRQIFFCLEIDDILFGIGQVNRTFHRINLDDELLWKNIYTDYMTKHAFINKRNILIKKGFRDAFFRQMKVNHEVRCTLKSLSLSEDSKQDIEYISKIAKYKSAAYPILLKTKQKGIKSCENYGLSMAFWANQLIYLINHIKYSDICIDTCRRLTDETEHDLAINLFLKMSTCEIDFVPRSCRSGFLELDELLEFLDDHISHIQGTYDRVSMILRILRRRKICRSNYLLYKSMASIQSIFALAEDSNFLGITDDSFASPAVVTLIMIYTCRHFGIKSRFIWMPWLMDTPHLKFVVSKEEMKTGANRIPERFHTDNGEAEFVFSPLEEELQTVENVNSLLESDIETGNLISAVVFAATKPYIDDSDKYFTKVTSRWGFFITLIIINSDEEHRMFLTKWFADSCPSAFPILENIISRISTAGKYFKDEIESAKAELTKINEELVVQRRDESINPQPKYHVGDLVILQSNGVYAIITGWDMEHNVYPEKHKCVFYHLLTPNYDISAALSSMYAPETSLKRISKDEVDEKKIDDLISLDGNYLLGENFIQYHAEETRFLPGKLLKIKYPDDFE